MVFPTTEILRDVAEELKISSDDLIRKGIHSYLERQLRTVQAEIFSILSRYNVNSVEDMEGRYRNDTLEEADSWQDLQRLDHLEYKRDQLQNLLDALL
ncbi:MAG: hypothetical protein B6I38_11475 [Anaerolineaceae bacterium 4572_5.1]|nr:MAG: hypothetical protein B6I38_11475 [Anaerolineaceae bacterium 4572_5.1]RLD06204.1 MAG: hypothetical protein DRI56_08435 [Chloroflexota bacterium]